MVVDLVYTEKRKTPWLVPRGDDVYTLYWKSQKDLQKKYNFLSSRLPVYGLDQPTAHFMGILAEQTAKNLLNNSAKQICIVDQNAHFLDFARFCVQRVKNVQIVSSSEKYNAFAEQMLEDYGAVVSIVLQPNKNFAVDFDKGQLYFAQKRLCILGKQNQNLTILYGKYKDGTNFSADRFVFDNGTQIALFQLCKMLCGKI